MSSAATHIYNKIRVEPITPLIGAEISGVDLTEPISAAVFDELQTAFHDHAVIFFRNQKLNPQQHLVTSADWRSPYSPPIYMNLI